MKKSPYIVAIIILLGTLGCSDGKQKNSEEAARHIRSAQTYFQQGQLRAAMLEAKNAVQQGPDDAAGYITLAKIYNQVGAFESTQTILENVVEKLPETSTELAEAFLAQKKYRSALSLLNSDTVKNHSNPDDKLQQLSIVARSHIALGDKDSYADTLALITSLEGAEAEVSYLKASFAFSQGKPDEAQQILEQSNQKFPEHLKSLIMLGELTLYRNDLEAAENYLTRALTLTRTGDVMTMDRAVVLTSLTQVLIQQGRTSEAYTYQKLLAEANPDGQAVQQKFNDAMELYHQGEFTEAEKMLQEIHEQYPGNKNAGTLLGLVQYQQGDNENAIDLLDQYIDPETTDSSIIRAAALAKYRTNQMDDAIALLKTSAESQPNNPTILATYGLALLGREDTSNEGALALEKSLALDPSQQRLRLALAKRYIATDKIEQAHAQLQKAYAEQPLDIAIQQSYYKFLLNQGRLDQLKKVIADYQVQYPDNGRGHFFDGWYKLEQKDYPGAQRAFEQALAAPKNQEKAMAYSGLARAYELDNQPVKAIAIWESVLQENPTVAGAYSHWLGIMQEQKRTDDALAFLKKLEKDKKAWQTSVVISQLLFNQRQTEQAIAYINTALERSNNSDFVKRIAANLYSQRGLELRAQQQIDNARQSQLKALELNPDNMAYLATLIETELQAGNVPEAQKLLNEYPQTTENAAGHLFLQGVTQRVAKNTDAALKLFRQSWEHEPNNNAAEAIYNHYRATDAQSQANEWVNQWLEKLPQSPRPTLIKAISAQQENDYDEATRWYEKTIELDPNAATSYNNLAWIYQEKNDPRALDMAKRALDLAPSSPPILDTYGWILVENGQVAEGYKVLERAAAAAPQSEEIQDHLNEARKRLQAQQ